MTTGYAQIEASTRQPKNVVDHAARWARLDRVDAVNGQTQEQLERFCASKRITLAALAALDARVTVRRGGRVELAFAGTSGSGAVTAIKYRPIGGSSRDCTAEAPSTWLRPLVAGNLLSADWFVGEGETDGARLFGLVGDAAAVMVLPAGARTFRREWAGLIPRGATVHLALDADEDGEEGADKAAKLIGGRTVRVRPPDGYKDWCEWPGSRDDFVELVAACRAQTRSYAFAPLDDFRAYAYPAAEPLLGEPGRIFLAVGSLLLVYGAEGTGKSTWTVDGIAHLAAGRDWLGIPVPRPVRFCVIENEGPPALFQNKLAAKVATWDGPPWAGNVFVLAEPWGEFTFADAAARDALDAFCEEHALDVVVANPTLGLGVAGSGRPDETQQFINWLVECGLKSTRAYWLLHHENKAGQISGDWGRHPDTKVQLQADGNQPRTKLIWEKTRWATLPTEEQPKSLMLAWTPDTQGYTIVDLEPTGASESELEARIDAYLTLHPWSSTTNVEENVKGAAARIRNRLDSGRYDSKPGPRNATLWHLLDTDQDPQLALDGSDPVETTTTEPTE